MQTLRCTVISFFFFLSRRRHTIFKCDWSSDVCFFFPSRRRHTRFKCDWSSDVCSSDLPTLTSTPVPFGGPADIGRQPSNGGIETLTALADGRIIAISEEYSQIGRASCRERV